MTEEQKKRLAENPKDFLNSCRYHEQRIQMKLEQIRHYKEIAQSVTAEIKSAPASGSGPSHKVENCAVEIVTLQEEIAREIRELRSDLAAEQEAIAMLEDESQRFLMEARYLRHQKWEEIAVLLGRSYRWTLRLHGQALEKISQQAMLIHI